VNYFHHCPKCRVLNLVSGDNPLDMKTFAFDAVKCYKCGTVAWVYGLDPGFVKVNGWTRPEDGHVAKGRKVLG
jgi:phage FluMu protein Com